MWQADNGPVPSDARPPGVLPGVLPVTENPGYGLITLSPLELFASSAGRCVSRFVVMGDGAAALLRAALSLYLADSFAALEFPLSLR